MDASLLRIEPAATEPIYRQIVAQIRRLVASGQLSPGSLLPSVRDIAALHAINPMTVSKAYSLLETEGVLERLRGKGMAIAVQATAQHSPQQRLLLLDPTLRAAARQARELELPAAQVLARLAHHLEDDSR
jgi:GntR family transcriptional regulator